MAVIGLCICALLGSASLLLASIIGNTQAVMDQSIGLPICSVASPNKSAWLSPFPLALYEAFACALAIWVCRRHRQINTEA
ncbi:hypothetical protein EXIGLDRAFT_729293, partial [Exidia glandulosa HHB12029]